MKKANYARWQTPPMDILENILQRLNLSDHIHLSTVCKFWNSTVTRSDIRCSPQFPWEQGVDSKLFLLNPIPKLNTNFHP
ncbi:hypothetical protein C1H46_022711 [Malus baccata]|uniref:F-box domain-containing protein n=1 Tax=Malus baccata TaxID=106549 RepID=A0A540LYZ8_MALBA|nr:hypothetical protein C1H46_022711 [Malus baccata]